MKPMLVNGVVLEIGHTYINKKKLTIYNTKEEPLFLAKEIAELIDYCKTGKGAYDVSSMVRHIHSNQKVSEFVFHKNKRIKMVLCTFEALCTIIMNNKDTIFNEAKRNIYSVLKEITTIGKYDAVEKKIENIEENTDIQNKMKAINLYNQMLQLNPNDYLTAINLKQTQQDLILLKQQNDIKQLSEKVEQQDNLISSITKINTRAELNNEIRSIARTYNRTLRDIYTMFYRTFLDVYGIDLQRRLTNIHNKMQEDRLAEGKSPFANKTLNQYCSKIDLIVDGNLWREASNCILRVRKLFLDELISPKEIETNNTEIEDIDYGKVLCCNK